MRGRRRQGEAGWWQNSRHWDGRPEGAVGPPGELLGPWRFILLPSLRLALSGQDKRYLFLSLANREVET